MTIKRDPAGRRSIQVEIEVPGSPEDVWEAIATGPGISAWFYPTDVEERVGGVLAYHTGSKMDVPATVTRWDPPHRFRHEGRDCGPDGPPTATEWTITPKAGGRCLVRVVHSLFASTDDWDDQLENFEAGWPVCFAVLRPYLAHFRGERASIIRATGAADGSAHEAWVAQLAALEAGGLSAGERWACSLGGTDFSGVVEASWSGRQTCTTFRLDRPAAGIAAATTYRIGPRATLVLSVYFYGEGAPRAASRHERGLEQWMADRFP